MADQTRVTAANVEDIERAARAFHETYERLAPQFGYRTREGSAVPWADVPSTNKSLMVATVRFLVARGVIAVIPATGPAAASKHHREGSSDD